MGGGEDMATPHGGERVDDGWHIWRGAADELPPADARRVHVNRPFNVAALQALLDACPELEEIQFIPSLWRLVGPRVAELLAEHSVRWRFGRLLRDGQYYDTPRRSELRERLRELAQGHRWELLRDLCPDAAELVASYIGQNGNQPLSQTRLAEERGWTLDRVRRHLEGLAAYLAGEPQERARGVDYERIVARAARRRALRAAQEARQAQAPIPIPVGLRRSAATWRQFLFVARVWVERPDLFQELRAQDERAWDILVGYFGLQEGVCVPMGVLAERYAVTRSRAQQLKNQGIAWLRKRLAGERKHG